MLFFFFNEFPCQYFGFVVLSVEILILYGPIKQKKI